MGGRSWGGPWKIKILFAIAMLLLVIVSYDYVKALSLVLLELFHSTYCVDYMCTASSI